MPGPYVQFATFCDRVLQEQDGVISIIRAVDGITITAMGQETPDEMPGGQIATTLALALKSDDARGRHTVTLTMSTPDMRRLDPQSFDVNFEGDERGVNFVLNVQVEAMEGLFWLDVAVNGVVLTRVPLRVRYQRLHGPVAR